MKLTTLATKAELKAEQDKMVKLQAFNSSYFNQKKLFFEDDDTQNFCQSVSDRYSKQTAISNLISA